MLLQRFPYHDRDGHEKRSGLRRSLVKAKRFHVATEIYNVAIGVLKVVSRQCILFHDREWPTLKDLCCD